MIRDAGVLRGGGAGEEPEPVVATYGCEHALHLVALCPHLYM